MLVPKLTIRSGGADAITEKIAALARCGTVSLDVAPECGKELVAQFEMVLINFICRVGVINASDVDTVTEWLNMGAVQVVVQGTMEEIQFIGTCLPTQRLVALLDNVTGLSAEDVAILGSSVGNVIVKVPTQASVEEILTLASSSWDLLGKTYPDGITIDCGEATIGTSFSERNSLVGKLHHLKGSDHPIHLEATNVQIPNASGEGKGEEESGFCLGSSFVSCLKTDRPDGLYATVVVDEGGVALGLVYSNVSSILASVGGGRAVYWSRSRNSLWRKGDTSGAYQELIDISFDCDCDAARFKVRQQGEPPSFCHKGCRTCWGDDSGLQHLFRTLVSRKASAPEGSYTKRLFDDKTLLRNKLLEEAQEVIEAVEENDPKHVAEEVADLAYFLFTACCSGNATLEDVSKVLDMRSRKVKRRPGNAKDFRIKAAEEALGNSASASSSS